MTGGGSITLNLPPQIVQAMSRKKNVAPTKTSSARAKAQASKALRQTLPEPTTGEVYAWATANTYSFRELIRSGRLPPNFQVFEDNEVIHIPQWPVPSASSASSSATAAESSLGRGEVFIFRSGSYVTWGLDEEQSQRFLRNVIQGRDLKFQVEVGRYSQVGDEAMDYLYASSQPTRVQGDMIVIGQPPKAFDAEAETTSEETSTDNIAAEEAELYDDATAASSATSTPAPLPTSAPPTPYTSFGTEWTPTLARLAFSQGLARSADFPSKNPPSPASSPPSPPSPPNSKPLAMSPSPAPPPSNTPVPSSVSAKRPISTGTTSTTNRSLLGKRQDGRPLPLHLSQS